MPRHPDAHAILREFPDYDGIDTLPTFPDGWECHPWHNDTCPCWEFTVRKNRIVRIWIDYVRDAKRESPGLPRCTVSAANPNTAGDQIDLHTCDDPAEALRFAADTIAKGNVP